MRKKIKILVNFFVVLILIVCTSADSLVVNNADADESKHLVYKFDIKDNIMKPAWRITQKAFDEANILKADYIIIHLNTYGGALNIADSIRTKILNSNIPVFVFIDNQAISAGALISIACDSIYMRAGGSLGAATVVSQSGEVVPDKYQSFMRSTMRATAESHGRDTVISGNDTVIKWHRDPKIAEAMVDPQLKVDGISDSGQVLTLTAEEALKVGYCEGLADNINSVIGLAGIENYELKTYKPSTTEAVIVFLLNPIVRAILIILIIGGIYIEMQTPGIGFPLVVAIAAALVFFAPSYLHGLTENWEILIFIVGIVLIALEIFVIPGFGVAGVSGIILVIVGLTMSLIDNIIFEYEGLGAWDKVLKAFFLVIISLFISFILSIVLSKKLFTSKSLRLALNTVQDKDEGYIGIDRQQKEMIGREGLAFTVLRPSGRVEIEGEIYDAKAEIGYIDKGEKIKVTRDEAGQLYVMKI
ncbi:MAG: nodulation protein NfeD [Bacteroidales bacterium]|nr:MAG: nodulation protein NfeD [Bacteroidales bacterium]